MKSNNCFSYRQSTSGPSLKFRQLKEYINSQRQFFLDRNDISKQNKVIHNKYYLIDENWVKQWKESINFEKFYEIFQNRFVTEDDYSLFIEHMPKSRSNNLLLNNSEVYDNKGEIKYLSNFIIVSSKCYDTFNEQRKKTVYDIKVTSPEILFLKDRFILTINSHIKIIYFQTNQSTKDEELIIIFQFGTKANIISEIENPDINIKSWLKEHDIDEVYQMCPMPGKNSWTYGENLQAIIFDEPLFNLGHNFIDDTLNLEKHYQEQGKSLLDDPKYEAVKNGTTSTDMIYWDLLWNDNFGALPDVLTDEEKEEIRKMIEGKED